MTLLNELVETSAAVASVSSRKEKTAQLAALLNRLDANEVEASVGFLIGDPRQGKIGVGFAALRDIEAPPMRHGELSVGHVDQALTYLAAISGPGSQAQRAKTLGRLYQRATLPEQEFLTRLLAGEVRQGALDGVMIEAIARAAEVAATQVRRANMLRGDLRVVAVSALEEGIGGLEAFGLEIFRPLEPMLAKTGESVADALAKLGGRAAIEWKLDGARVQVHRRGDEIRVYTRNLRDITSRVPEVVDVVKGFAVNQVVLDGELIALDGSDRPRPFQETMSRFGRDDGDDQARRLSPFFFDILHLDGVDLIDVPAANRCQALAGAVANEALVPRLVTEDPGAAEAFSEEALAAGHEGVMVKDLDSPYQAGRRGAGWLKVKPIHTLDLVILAAEWGHGRRTGWLSNLHLGARDPESGEFVMLGKTFKGLTDQMLAWQTERLQALAVESGEWVVRVRPELVVEIAIDGVQASTRYPGGVALRFARVKGYREDKSPSEADTIDTVRALFDK